MKFNRHKNKHLILGVVIIVSILIFFYILLLNFGFPVNNPIDMEYMSRIPDDERLIYSIVSYIIWLSTLLVIPFYAMQYFKNQRFYENYIITWLIASVVSAMLYNALVWGDWLPNGAEFIIHIIFILLLTLPPAIYQNNKAAPKS